MGFVDGGLLVFKGTKTTDCHEEMNAKVFEEWFQKVLQLLPDNAVIVMDNASYHSRKVEQHRRKRKICKIGYRQEY